MNLIFDLDDTLYDLAESFRKTHIDLLAEKLGEECERLFRMSRIYSDEVLPMEQAGIISSEEAFFHRIHRTYEDVGLDLEREIVDEFAKKYRYYQHHITVPDGIKEVLDYCKTKQHNIGILSNGKIKKQDVKIEALELLRWFEKEKIFISEATSYIKPDLEAFRYVEEHLQLEPQQIWYVGDTYEADVVGGKNAGWNVIWYNHRHRSVPEGKNIADITVHTPKELLEVLKKLG